MCSIFRSLYGYFVGDLPVGIGVGPNLNVKHGTIQIGFKNSKGKYVKKKIPFYASKPKLLKKPHRSTIKSIFQQVEKLGWRCEFVILQGKRGELTYTHSGDLLGQ